MLSFPAGYLSINRSGVRFLLTRRIRCVAERTVYAVYVRGQSGLVFRVSRPGGKLFCALCPTAHDCIFKQFPLHGIRTVGGPVPECQCCLWPPCDTFLQMRRQLLFHQQVHGTAVKGLFNGHEIRGGSLREVMVLF